MQETLYECPTCGDNLRGIANHPESSGYLWCETCQKWTRPCPTN